MRITFRGFAVDCTIDGEVELVADRLKDQLDQDDTLVVFDATLTSLDDGREVRVAQLDLDRHDLYAAIAVPPRGPNDRRIRTVRHGVLVTVGPYTVNGDLHEKPGTRPMTAFHTTRPIASLTDATISFMRAGRPEKHRVDTLLVNRDRVDAVVPGVADDMPLTTHASGASRNTSGAGMGGEVN